MLSSDNQIRKICVVIVNRANYGRIKSVLSSIKNHPKLKLQLIVTSASLLYRFGNAIDIIQKDGFEIDAKVYSIIEGENPTTMAKSTGLGIIELATLFESLGPDIILTVADRFETMSTAIAASYMNIPLAHTQGGEVTGSIDESVRHAITKLSHIHFPATSLAGQRLHRMGENPKMIVETGCPSIDCLVGQNLTITKDFEEKYGGVGPSIDFSKPYLVVLQHPVTTEFGRGLEQINETLQAIAEIKVQTVWLWPNIDAGSDDVSKGLRTFRERHRDLPIHFYRNFAVEDYARLINNCSCLIGNSSSAIREGSFLGVPAVNIGSRQNNRERGQNVIDVDHNSEQIVNATRKQIGNGKYPSNQLYGDGKAGQRIAQFLSSVEVSIQKEFHMWESD